MKCRVCIDGDCHLCTRYVGSVEIEGERVQDCCCLHQFDPPVTDGKPVDPGSQGLVN